MKHIATPAAAVLTHRTAYVRLAPRFAVALPCTHQYVPCANEGILV